MTYDLCVLQVDPGLTWTDVLAKRDADPGWPPSELRPEQAQAWERIVRRVHSEVGQVHGNLSVTDAVLSVEDPQVQVRYQRDEASIEIPYGYSGADAIHALERGYTLARIVAEETGWVAVDPAIGRLIPNRVSNPSA